MLPEIVAVFVGLRSTCLHSEQPARVEHIDFAGDRTKSAGPFQSGASKQERPSERTRNVAEAIQAFVEGSVEQEWVRACPRGPVAPQRAQIAVEQVLVHGGACATR